MFKKKTKTTIVIASLGTLLFSNSITTNAVTYMYNHYKVTYPNTYDTSWEGGNVFGSDYNLPTKYCGDKSLSAFAKYCYCRTKTNDSSIYVYNKSNKDAKVDVFAGDLMQSGNELILWSTQAGSYYSKKLTVYDLTIPKKSERKIYQFIYENRSRGGRPGAHMHFTTSNTYGVWSPDCAYEWSYQPVNP